MLVEAKQAFYNEETGAVQPWRDIEVTDTLGNELVSEGLVAAIAAGGGGGGDFSTANVTIVGDDGGEFYVSIEYIEDDNAYGGAIVGDSGFTFGWSTIGDEGETRTVYYPGDSLVLIPGTNVTATTGDAVYDSYTNTVTVTGDCVITGYLSD